MAAKTKKIKVGKLVLVEWEDAGAHTAEWLFVEGLDFEPKLCRSVGWVVHDTTRTLAIVSTHGYSPKDSEQVSGVVQIPRGMVRRVRRLE